MFQASGSKSIGELIAGFLSSIGTTLLAPSALEMRVSNLFLVRVEDLNLFARSFSATVGDITVRENLSSMFSF